MQKIIIKENNLYGVMDETGKVIVEPFYDLIHEYANGYAVVCKDEKWGYIDEEGKVVIELLYDQADDFTTFGVAPILRHDPHRRWSLVKENGEIIGPPKGDNIIQIYDFNQYGCAIVWMYSHYRILDTDGNFANEDRYFQIDYIEDEEIFRGQKIGQLCFINSLGEVVIDPEKSYDMLYFPTNGLSIVEKDDKVGYMDENGREVIPLQYELGGEFANNGLAFVKMADSLGGYINKKGETVIQPEYDTGSFFNHGLAAVSKEDEFFFIDDKGKQAINQTFKNASAFSNCGLAKVAHFDGKQSLIQPDGTIVVHFEKQVEISEFIGDKTITTVKLEDKVALMNSEGEMLTKFDYDAIELSFDSHLHRFLKDGLWGYLNEKGQIAIENIYDAAAGFTDYNIAQVALRDVRNRYEEEYLTFYINDKDEVIDPRSVEIFEMAFEMNYANVERFHDNMTIAMKKEEKVVLDGYGQELLI